MPRASTSPLRLLAVDDEPEIGRLVAIVASRAGFEVRTVDNPGAFREQLAAWRPTHVLVDLQMPDADGVELLREVGGLPHGPRVMILSGVEPRVLAAARRWAVESGLDVAAVMGKPVRLHELRAVLEEVAGSKVEIGVETLAEALDGDQLFLQYQPKVRAVDHRMVGVEALVRWRHPVRGLVPPDDFIPIAEQSGLIADLTDWIARTAIGQAGAWRAMGLDLDVALNLSAASLHDLALPDRLEAMCRDEGVEPATIVIEITESAAMSDARAALEILTRLRIKSFGLSIDDFGVGYSSMRELRRMPFSELKLDASFLEDGLDKADDAAIVGAIVALGHGLGLTVVAEGIEDAATLAHVRELGCDLLQGYHLGRPMEAAAIEARARA